MSRISDLKSLSKGQMLLPLALYILVLGSGCTSSRSFDYQGRVVGKNQIILDQKESAGNTKELKKDLRKIIPSKPKYGLFRWRLGLHKRVKEPIRSKGFRNWLKNKIGSPPIYYSEKEVDRTILKIDNYLNDAGYFMASVQSDTSGSERCITTSFKVNLSKPFTVRKYEIRSDSSELGGLLKKQEEGSKFREGSIYKKEDLLFERDRLASKAADNGFMDITKDDMIFYLDTSHQNSSVDVYVQLKPNLGNSKNQPVRLNSTWIYQDYSLGDQQSGLRKDTFQVESFQFVHNRELMNPEKLLKSIPRDSGEWYSRLQSEQALNRLLDLGVYKFANIKYQEVPKRDNFVDRHIYLTPGDIRDISLEIRANTRTGNYLGSGLILSYTDRNLFKGAERFSLSASGAVETQFGDDGSLINTAEAGLQVDLLLPYTWPFVKKTTNRLYTPKTATHLAYNFEKRTEFYTLSSLAFQFGYDWRASRKKRYQFIPISINRINVLDQTKELEDLLIENPSLRSSFEDVFISGAQFIYSYSNRDGRGPGSYMFFKSSIETAGNLFYLLNAITGSEDRPYQFLDLPIAQYVKLDTDFRYYLPYGEKSLVFRLFGGIGASYGNSSVLPYVKQYYSGGSNGIRAFQIRTLGPGSYLNPDFDSNENEFFDQIGDLKLEANVEYRFPVWGYLKGALFMDIGNIWLLSNENDTRQGGVFQLDQFLSEMALGTGFGFRLDIRSFVVRLDLAFPLTKPFLPKGERWVGGEIDIFNGSWRKENLVWNLALGYPF